MYNEATLIQEWYLNRNHISRRFYLGIGNQRRLKEAGYSIPERLTLWQAKQAGLKIKPGSKGIVVEYKDNVEVEEREGNQIVKKTVPYRRTHVVFNVAQTEAVKV